MNQIQKCKPKKRKKKKLLGGIFFLVVLIGIIIGVIFATNSNPLQYVFPINPSSTSSLSQLQNPPTFSIQTTEQQSWINTYVGGAEENLTFSAVDQKDKKTSFCWTLQSGKTLSDTTDRYLSYENGSHILDDKNKDIKLKWENSAQCGGLGFHIDLTNAKAENIDTYVKLGDTSSVLEYQNISTIQYIDNILEVNSTLEKCDENRENCGIGYPDVLIVDTDNIKFGATDNSVNENTNYKYTFKSTQPILQDSIGYYMKNGNTIRRLTSTTEDRVRINTNDICNQLTNFSNDCTYNEYSVYINETNSTDYYLEVYFTNWFNETNGTMFIDPSYTVEEFTSSDSIDTNVTQENNFTHLEVITEAPYDSLVLYMPFDDNQSSTTQYDYSVTGADGTMEGDAKVVDGLYGKAMEFDGNDDRIGMSGDLGLSGNNYTSVSLWIKIDDLENTENSFFQDGNNNIWCYWDDTSRYSFYVDTSGGSGAGQSIIMDTNWHHFVGTYNSTTIILYIDGINVDEDSTLSGDIDAMGDIDIGGKTAEWEGLIDEVMVFNISLTQEQVLEIYRNQSSRFKVNGTQELKQFNATFDDGWFKWTEDSESLFDSSLEKRVGEWEISNGYNDTLSVNPTDFNYGLVGYWHFDNLSSYGENDSLVYDFSGNGNNGSVVGASVDSEGYYDGAYSFDGISGGSHINVGDDFEGETNQSVTISLWAKRDGDGGNTYEGLFGKSIYLSLMYYDDSGLRVYASNSSKGSQAVLCSGGTAIEDGNWHHVVMTYDTTNWSIYYDSSHLCSDEGITGETKIGSYDFKIGSYDSGADLTWNGSIDEVMVFNRSLSDDEIKELYVKGRANFQYGDWESTDTTYYPVQTTSTNFLLEYGFNAGNSTNPFYSPLLKTSTANPINASDEEALGTDVWHCGSLSTANTIYTQIQDIVQTKNADCIIVTAENITFNGNGYSITSTQNVSGVYSNKYNTTVTGCNVSMGVGSGGVGVELYESHNSSVLNTSIKYTYYALHFGDSDYGTANNIDFDSASVTSIIFSNTISGQANNITINGGQQGIRLINSNNVSIKNVNITDTTSTSVDMDNCDNNSFINITSYEGGTNNINLEGSSLKNYFENIKVNGSNYGFRFDEDSNENIVVNLESHKNSRNLLLQECANNTIINANLTDSSVDDVWTLTYSLNNTLINVTYDTIDIDPGHEIIRKWYYQAYVNDSAGSAISGADVVAYNVSGAIEFNVSTNSSGYTNITYITEYVNLGGTKTYYSNYNINATDGTNYDGEVYNVTTNLNKLDNVFTLGVAGATDNSPTVDLSIPENKANFTNGTIVTFGCNATDDWDIANLTLYVWNEDGSLNHTNLTSVPGIGNTSWNATWTYNFTVDGIYNWSCLVQDNGTQTAWNITGGGNWTLNISEGYIPVVDEEAPNVTNLQEPTDPSTYDNSGTYQFNATIVDGSSLDTIILQFNYTNYTAVLLTGSIYNVTLTHLSATNYTYLWWVNDTGGYVNNSETGSFNVSSAIPEGSLSGTASITYGTAGDVEGTESNAGDDGVGYTLFRNNISVSNPDTTVLGVGTYFYRYNATSGVNWTDNASMDTFELTVTQETGEIAGWINGTESNFTATNGTATTNIYLNATNSTGDGLCLIYVNNSLYNNGTCPQFNITNLSVGLYNVTYIYQGNTNYSKDTVVWWVNNTIEVIPDSIPPNISITSPTNDTETSDSGLEINYTTADETALDTCWWTNNSGVTNTTITCNTNITGQTWDEGSNHIRIYVNDTTNNENSTSITFTVDTTAPTIDNLNNQTIYDNQSLSYDIDATDSGVGVSKFSLNQTTNFTINADTGVVTNQTGLGVNRSYWLEVSVNDTLGNSVTGVFYVNVTGSGIADAIPPTITITYPSNSSYSINITDLNYTFTEINPDSCWWSLDSGATNSTFVSMGINFTDLTSAEGGNYIIVWCNDSSGNLGSTDVHYSQDTIAPNVTLLEPINDTISSNTSYNFTANLSDDVGLDNATLYIYNQSDNSLINKTFVDITNGVLKFTIGTVVVLGQGIYTWFWGAIDLVNNLAYASQNNTLTVDLTAPTFDNLANQTIMENQSLSYDIDATDNFADVQFALNQTTNFTINIDTGVVTNTTGLGVNRSYWLTVTINDTTNNETEGVFYVNVTNSTSGADVSTIDLDVIIPTDLTTTFNSTQNTFFNVTVNVTCRGYDCGEINVSLDPELGEIGKEIGKEKQTPTISHTESTDTSCLDNHDGTQTCNKILYSGIRNVYEDETWKKVEDARSLKNQGFEIITLQDDKEFLIEVIDFNLTSITLDLKLPENSKEFNKDIPIRVWEVNYTKEQEYANDVALGLKQNKPTKERYKETYEKIIESNERFSELSPSKSNTYSFGMGKILGFGYNSTIITINSSNYDGIVYGGDDTNWSDAHEVGDGISTSGTTASCYVTNLTLSTPDLIIHRIFISFNTSLMEEDWGVSNASLNLFENSISTPNSNIIIQGSYNNLSLSASDYNSFFDNNISFKLISDIIEDDWNVFYFNNFSFINKSGFSKIVLRNYDYDFLDISFPGNNAYLSRFYMSESVSHIPYLNITYVVSSLTKGLINTTIGATPFYTNESNPRNITLTADTSQLVTFWVNATGTVGNNYTFFVYANQTSDLNVSNRSDDWNVTIQEPPIGDVTAPTISIVNPSNNTNTSNNGIHINITVSDETALDTCWWTNNSGVVNTTITCGTNITSQTWDEGSNHIRVYANDTSNNEGSDSITFTLDTTAPTFDDIYNVTIYQNQSVNEDFNASDSGVGFGTWIVNNTGNFSIDNTGQLTNITALESQRYYLNLTINDTVNNINEITIWVNVSDTIVIDTIAPNVTINYPTNTSYSATSINFNVTSLDETGMDSCLVSLNSGVDNFTMGQISNEWNYTNESIGDGDYTAVFYCNDSSNNLNNTETITFQIDTTPPTFDSLVNQTIMENESLSYDIDASDTGVGGIKFALNQTTNFTINIDTGVVTNTTGLGVNRSYWLEVVINDSLNNDATGVFFVNVTNSTSGGETEPPSVVNLQKPADQSKYINGEAYQFNATVIDLTGVDTVILQFNGVNYTAEDLGSFVYNVTILDLEANAQYNFSWFANDTNGYANNSENGTFVLEKAETIGSISGTSPITYGTAGDVEGSESNLGDDDVGYNLFRDNVSVSNPDTTILGVGTYFYRYNATGGTNWTTNLSIGTLELTVNQGTGDVKGWINGTESNFTTTNGTSHMNIWLNTTNITGYGNCKIIVNGTTYNDGTCPQFNHTNLSTGLYNISFIYDGNANYTSDIVVWWVNITNTTAPPDTTPPYFTTIPGSATLEYLTDSLEVDFDADDNIELDSYSSNETDFPINSTGGLTNNTALSVGTYLINITINDTSNNLNSTIYQVDVEDTTPPSIDDVHNVSIYVNQSVNADFNASDLSAVDDWDVNNTDFSIDSTGQFTNNTGIAVGVYYVNLSVNDSYNNWNSVIIWVNVSATIDTTIPTFTDIHNVSIYANQSVSTNFNATDETSFDSFAINWTDTFSITKDGNLTNTSALSTQIYYLNVTINDSSNNINSMVIWVNVSDIIDTTNPVVSIIYPENTSYSQSTLDLNYTVTDETALNVCWYSNDSGINNYSIQNPAVNWSAVVGSEGSNTWKVWCNDTSGNEGTDNVTFTIDTTAPTLDNLANQTIYDNQSISYNIDATDSGVGLGTFSLNETVEFTINSATGVLTNQTGLGVNTTYWLEVTVNDTIGNSVTGTFFVNVTDSGIPDTTPPTWDNLRNFTQDSNTSFSQSITASDASGIDTYSLNQTTNFTINSATGLITNSTTLNNYVGIFWLNISVNDTSNNFISGEFFINVTAQTAPVTTGLSADDMYIAYNYENVIQGDMRFNYGWEY